MARIFKILGFLMLASFIALMVMNGMNSEIQSGLILSGVLIIIGFVIKFRSAWSVFFGLIFLLGFLSYGFVTLTANLGMYDFEWSDTWDIEESEDEVDSEDEDFEGIPIVEMETDESSGKDFYTRTEKWKDNKRKRYNATFKVLVSDANKSTHDRENHNVYTDNGQDYWTDVYDYLYRIDKKRLDDIISTYEAIGKEEKLDTKEFADMIVTSIQNIPYTLVHEFSHKEADEMWGGYISEYHEEGGPCLDKIKFGLQSPVEFMANAKGDCDTRSVYLYLILTYFDYDVVVLASDVYGHAILGIAGNYKGKYVKYKGTKYFGWETTATGYSPGMMAADYGNMNHWYVSLESKN